MELSTQLLQDMLDGKYDIQNPSKVEQIDENNNNGETTYLINNHKYSFVVLDEIVEEILLTLDEELFNACFPFDKVMLRCFIMELRQKTHYPLGSDWGYCGGLTFDLGVLVTLSYLMNGSLDLLVQLIYFQGYSADNLKRCVEKMCQTFVHFLSPTYVKFPYSSEDQEANKSAFMSKFGVPGIIGVLDCFHIRLLDIPPDEMHMYLHRRNLYPTLATQLICDQNYCFLDVNARFSGATHNIHIWKRSHVNAIVQNAQKQNTKTWLVADRGYNLTSSIVNPYRNPTDMLQETVNVALKEVQTVALKSFAILKARFRCLHTSLPFTHLNATNIITSCVTLHNYLLAKGQPIEENLSYEVPIEPNLPNAHCEDVYCPKGVANREYIKDYMYNKSMQVLYKMRRNSNLSFISDCESISPK